MSYEYSAVLLADLIYSDDEQKLEEELSDNLKILADIAKLFFNHENVSKGKEIDSSEGYIPFVSCISRYKHFGFSEENEVRVVALPTLIDDQIIKLAKADGTTIKPEKVRRFRSTKEQRVPYIELFDSANIKLPIEKIIIGPHKNKEARKEELLVCKMGSSLLLTHVVNQSRFKGHRSLRIKIRRNIEIRKNRLLMGQA